MLQDNPDTKQGVSSDEDIKLKVQLTQFALRKLDLVVDEFWAEISDSIQIIEVCDRDGGDLLGREGHWQHELQTFSPGGINIRDELGGRNKV